MMLLRNKQRPRQRLTQQSGVLTSQPRVTLADTNERDSGVMEQNNRTSISNGETPVDRSRSVVGWLWGTTALALYFLPRHVNAHRVVLFTRRLLSLRQSHPRFYNYTEQQNLFVSCILDVSLNIWKLNMLQTCLNHPWRGFQQCFATIFYHRTYATYKITQALAQCVYVC